MTQHPHAQGHHNEAGHHDEAGHAYDHEHDEAGMAEILELDALVLQEHFREILQWTAARQANPGTVMDLGAGTGTGTFGLARTFPEAEVIAVDQSKYMLERLAAKIPEHAPDGRVSTLRVDLDTDWPERRDVDLIWAASSMHHMGDPESVFRRVGETLSPHGLLVVVEMDDFPRYLPDDLGFGTPGLEKRCHQAVAQAGWNSYPDWSAFIESAGLAGADRAQFHYVQDADPQVLVRIARTFLTRMRDSLNDQLSAEDLGTLDELLDLDGPRGLAARTDLSMRGSRTVWTARRREAAPMA